MMLPTPLISSTRTGWAVNRASRDPSAGAYAHRLRGRRAPPGEFLADFPSVTRDHAVTVLQLARQALLSQAVISAA